MKIFYKPQLKSNIQRERLKAKQLRSTKWWKQKLEEGICYYCQKTFSADQLTMDHKLPLARGGFSSKSNIVVSCQNCNTKKGTKTSVDFVLEKSKIHSYL